MPFYPFTFYALFSSSLELTILFLNLKTVILSENIVEIY